jgi:hypothetical protein
MPKISRENSEDAKKIVEEFLGDYKIRKVTLDFLSEAIIYSNGLNPNNWNLNLDKNGSFIRFNIGHEYCIEIFNSYVSILVLKETLKRNTDYYKLKIDYKGYVGNKKIISRNLSEVPDCLVKVPNSVACHVLHEYVIETLPYLVEPNRSFIAYAIQNTVQLPSMNKAHSSGFISYLSKFCSKTILNPFYFISEKAFFKIQENEEKEARRLSIAELEKKANDNSSLPERINTTSLKFKRNPYVVEYTKRIANGVCQDCKQPAPFLNKTTKEPFLEIHHIKPLAEDGKDTIENTIALCPNCHRKRHFG